MATYKAFSPKIELVGQVVLGLVEGMGAFGNMALQILSQHGITNPQAENWYSQQAYLDAFKEIATKTGPKTIQQTGKRIIDVAIWPPGVDTFEKALTVLPQAYQMNHRGGNPGKYEFIKTGENQGTVICTNPYPDEFDLGILQGIVAKFMAGKGVTIDIDGTQPTRSKGAESTTFLISW
jgi:hypothetical protein